MRLKFEAAERDRDMVRCARNKEAVERRTKYILATVEVIKLKMASELKFPYQECVSPYCDINGMRLDISTSVARLLERDGYMVHVYTTVSTTILTISLPEVDVKKNPKKDNIPILRSNSVESRKEDIPSYDKQDKPPSYYEATNDLSAGNKHKTTQGRLYKTCLLS